MGITTRLCGIWLPSSGGQPALRHMDSGIWVGCPSARSPGLTQALGQSSVWTGPWVCSGPRNSPGSPRRPFPGMQSLRAGATAAFWLHEVKAYLRIKLTARKVSQEGEKTGDPHHGTCRADVLIGWCTLLMGPICYFPGHSGPALAKGTPPPECPSYVN